MAYKQNSSPSLCRHLFHFSEAFLLELHIADGQYFVHDQNFRFQMGGNCKSQADIHATGVMLDGGIEKLFHFSKGDYLVEFIFYFGLAHAEDRAIEINIFPSTEFGMKTGSDFQQTSHAALDRNLA